MPPGGALDDAGLAQRAAGLEWLLLDVDGVFTDGRLYYTAEGEHLKRFHVRDGFAVALARRAGLRMALLSGRSSAALRRRAEELGLDAVLLGRDDKLPAFESLLAEHHLAAAQVAYVGDDLMDLPVLARAGLSFAPADAAPEVRRRVHRVLGCAGGTGAVREMVETVLKARGDWRRVVAPWLDPVDAG